MSHALEQVRIFIDARAREGFDSAHEIVEDAVLHAREKGGPGSPSSPSRATISRLVAERVAAHRAGEAEWERSTDCDRLDAAFESLNRGSVVARQHFSCCNNCGFTEIWDEVEAEERRRTVEGYVFYHLQCTERAVETGQLLMAYGSVDEDPDQLRRVAETVVAELRRAGLDASWAGTTGHPITVDGIVWRRRRPQ